LRWANALALLLLLIGTVADEFFVASRGTTTFISQTWDAAGRRTSLNSGMGFQPMFE